MAADHASRRPPEGCSTRASIGIDLVGPGPAEELRFGFATIGLPAQRAFSRYAEYRATEEEDAGCEPSAARESALPLDGQDHDAPTRARRIGRGRTDGCRRAPRARPLDRQG